MTTYFIEGRIYRTSDEHYWTIGLRIESFTMQDALTAAEAFNFGLAGSGGLRFYIEKAAMTSSRGRFYLTLRDTERLRVELKDFLEGK